MKLQPVLESSHHKINISMLYNVHVDRISKIESMVAKISFSTKDIEFLE